MQMTLAWWRRPKTFPDQRICWFSLLSETPNESVVIRNGMITAVFDGQTTAIARVADIPITLGGKATYNVSNALAAYSPGHRTRYARRSYSNRTHII